jgi:pSer/pThr/pTyr-binding forkhead associated (FHA) protein
MLFCDRCGVYLVGEKPEPTEPMPKETLPGSNGYDGLPRMEGIEAATVPPNAVLLRLTVVRSGRQVHFPLPITEIRVGRRDPSRGHTPELDVTPDGGQMEGVSRIHALIYQTNGHLVVEDMASVNGTYLNGLRLMPCLPYGLRAGDKLHLGRLELLVDFE